MAVSRKRAELKGKSINNRSYPIIITTFGNGTFSKCIKTQQLIKADSFISDNYEIIHHKARVITHYKVLS